jgi:hypothetical protein
VARIVQTFQKFLPNLSAAFKDHGANLPMDQGLSPLDVLINRWAQKRRTLIQAVYKEEGIRHIDFLSEEGNRQCQILIDEPNPRIKEFGLRVTDGKSRKKDFVTNMKDLPKQLDEAFAQAQRWMNER